VLQSESPVAEDALVADQTDHPGEPVAVTAAGAIPWRVNKDSLEVLLIHRPRYDDWSWPKGKIDDGETVPECAIREVEEEIGLTAALGIPLPPIHYHVPAGLKVVHYWAVDADGATLRPDGKEVDSVMWCAPEKAARLLSNPSDAEPLEYLVKAHSQNELDTWPLLILRHAKAKPRSSWTKAEGERPLAATGRRQAQAIGRLLHAWKPLRIVTSPWLRCVATVAPYAKASDAKVKVIEALTEHKHSRSPQKTAAVVESLLDKQRGSILCTHRPALPTVFKQLGHHMKTSLRELLPSKDPYLTPGEVLVCHVARHKIVAVERFKPFDD
jgi:8-oxo-dGTP diphosphatase